MSFEGIREENYSPTLRASQVAKESLLSQYNDPFTAHLLSRNRTLMTMTMPTRRRSAHGTNPRDYNTKVPNHHHYHHHYPFSQLQGRRFISAHVLRGVGIGSRGGIDASSNGSYLYHLDTDGSLSHRSIGERGIVNEIVNNPSTSSSSLSSAELDTETIETLLDGIDMNLSFAEQRTLLLSKQDIRRNDVFSNLSLPMNYKTTSDPIQGKDQGEEGKVDESKEATAQFQLAQLHALQWQALLIRQHEQRLAQEATNNLLISSSSSSSLSNKTPNRLFPTIGDEVLVKSGLSEENSDQSTYRLHKLDRSMSADVIIFKQDTTSVDKHSSTSKDKIKEKETEEIETSITSWNWNVFAIDLSVEEPRELQSFDYNASSSTSTTTSSSSSNLRTLATPPLPPQSPLRPIFHHLNNSVHSPSLTLGETRLLTAVESIFRSTQSLDLISHFNIDINMFRDFVLSIRNSYHANPFHNFYHAVDVLQAVSCLCGKGTAAGAILTPIDKLAALLAALGHDLDHPGHNNGFEVASFSDRALLHNDEAVLERHHAYTLWKILLSSGSSSTVRTTQQGITGGISTNNISNSARPLTTTSPRPSTTTSISAAASAASAARFASYSSSHMSHSSPELISSSSSLSLPSPSTFPVQSTSISGSLSATPHSNPSTQTTSSTTNSNATQPLAPSHSCALLSGLSISQLRDVRRISIRAILHTDMSLHFSTVAALHDRASSSSSRLVQHVTGLDDTIISSRTDEESTTRGSEGDGVLGRFASESSVHSVVRRLQSQEDIMLTRSTSTMIEKLGGTTTPLLSPTGPTIALHALATDSSPSIVHVEDEGDDVVTSPSVNLYTQRQTESSSSSSSRDITTTTPSTPLLLSHSLPSQTRVTTTSTSSTSTTYPVLSTVTSSTALAFDPSSDTERSELVSVLVHLADLSGQSRPEKQRLNWGARIVAEFRHQAIKEKTLGLPVTPFMHALETPIQAARLQMTFVSNIVLPLFRAVQACGLLDDGEEGPITNLIKAECNYKEEEVRLLHELQKQTS
jgi:hypothetical protein